MKILEVYVCNMFQRFIHVRVYIHIKILLTIKVLMIHMPAVDFIANPDKLFNKVLETVSTNTSNKTDIAHNQTKMGELCTD